MMVDELVTEKPADCHDRALLLIGYAGAPRRSERVGLDVNDVVESFQRPNRRGSQRRLSVAAGISERVIARTAGHKATPCFASKYVRFSLQGKPPQQPSAYYSTSRQRRLRQEDRGVGPTDRRIGLGWSRSLRTPAEVFSTR
jgi:hypothetical protein